MTGLDSTQTFYVSCVLAVLLLSLMTFLARRKSKSSKNTVLFVGASDAGKTAILSSLAFHQPLPTHASLQTNSSLITLPNVKQPVQAVDIPGHPRIRVQYRDYFNDAKAVIFVVDASTVSRNGSTVAEYLHEILRSFMSIPPSQSTPALIILAHKSDLLASTTSSSNTPADQLAVNRVRTILERELEKRRQSQSGGMGIESLGGGEGDNTEISGLECSGVGGGVFKFSDWEGGEVTFLGTSAPREKDQDEKAGNIGGLESLRQRLSDLY
ncbi:signal recognition particle receptor beta subunit-domain-containing protein [Thelephora terrestris]|uniref:Signal recognition particle receptor subunit beta n=1 Tax=Thelephora terrestris TaxID=56493 RepID=A0A9P6HNQ1_9AGAM|nr:signal recognition particle receptor beta subunit-domain-containing protein [Thelephora terrestris]